MQNSHVATPSYSGNQPKAIATRALVTSKSSRAGSAWHTYRNRNVAAAAQPLSRSAASAAKLGHAKLNSHATRVPRVCSTSPDVSSTVWPPPEGPGDFDYDDLTQEEITERVEEAAQYICILDDLRPLQREGFNAFYEIWRRIARVPPEHRARLLAELEPGAIRSLWKSSMARYVLDEERSLELFSEYNIFCDFPTEPGEVYTYEGRCEKFVYKPPVNPFDVDSVRQRQAPRATPWLKPAPGSWEFPQEAFKMSFFMGASSRCLHCHTAIKWRGPLYRQWLPCYSRVDVGLALTPLQADAGADITMVYPGNGQPAVLAKGDLPQGWWPDPKPSVWSPFSLSERDYVRVAGPGVYVGCAYRSTRPGQMLEDDFMYFVIVRVE